ncbi:MAG: hypothetical protein KBS53_03785 [Bacteroidales bacterium]|nr:hypothetical protein [Candidatus Hennigimonas equi]
MKKLLFFALAICVFASCHVSYNATAAYSDSPTKFLKLEGDGSITVRASARGRNYKDSWEQAGKRAVRDIIFKGVDVPGNAFMSKPLVTEVNAEEKYQDFFNAFFTDNGDYSKFVSDVDRRAASSVETKADAMVKHTITVRVLRAELRHYLVQNGIIR